MPSVPLSVHVRIQYNDNLIMENCNILLQLLKWLYFYAIVNWIVFHFNFRIQQFQEMKRSLTLPLKEDKRKMSLSNGLTPMIFVGQRY